jgi:ribosomal protein S12
VRVRLITVDGKNAVAYVLGTKLVVAMKNSVLAKDGTHDDLKTLDHALHKHDLAGFQEVKR